MLGDYSSDIEERTAAAVRELRETARDQLYKIGLPGKWILGDYFQENRTSRRPFLLLRISFLGRPIFIQFVPDEGGHHLGGAPLRALTAVLHDEALQVRPQERQHGVAVVAEQGLQSYIGHVIENDISLCMFQ